MNLSLSHLKKDACDTCTKYKLKKVGEDEMKVHRENKERARVEKKMDKKSPCTTIVAAIDLQKIIPLPTIFNQLQYYLQKIGVRNWTAFDLKSRAVICKIWDECDGGVDASNFATHVCLYIDARVQGSECGILEFILWSDSCAAQNRNVVLANALLALAMKLRMLITQKFFIPGHSQSEVDSAHSNIERAMRGKCVYSLENFAEIIKAARLTGTKEANEAYMVERVTQNDFKDYSSIQFYSSIRPGTRPGDLKVNDLRALQYTPEGIIKFKTSFDEEWKNLPEKHKLKDPMVEIKLKYTERIPIPKSKFDHLQKMKNFIPEQYHSYYDGLPYK
ncbi:hypothetical protein B566_EDAN008766 [Ephemera danica]|nr:hypothetical protein B566_EDAN008766 [Ephemera danica]